MTPLTLFPLLFLFFANINAKLLTTDDLAALIRSLPKYADLLAEFAINGNEKAEEQSLCQKHSELYLQKRNNIGGWAFQSKFQSIFRYTADKL